MTIGMKCLNGSMGVSTAGATPVARAAGLHAAQGKNSPCTRDFAAYDFPMEWSLKGRFALPQGDFEGPLSIMEGTRHGIDEADGPRAFGRMRCDAFMGLGG